ncbi:MAG: superoxide dismutase family protein, partial [Parvularculaceae bacterium]
VSLRVTAIAFGACLAASCGAKNDAARPMLDDLAPGGLADAAAPFVDRAGKDVGRVVLSSATGGVLLRVDLKCLPEGWHGIHFHDIGDCSDGADGFQAAGGHVDPDSREHGLMHPEGFERGDLPNIYAGPDGRATAEFFRAGVSLKASEEAAAENGPYPLIDNDGFAVIVHENPDDQSTQPIGGAAGRVACASIRS